MIYFMRHGETQANVDVIFAGPNTNTPLTEKGREQAHQEGEKILRKNIIFDRIITSSAKRAVHTAEIIAAVIGVDPSCIRHDKKLQEYDLGELDGKSAFGVTAAQRVSAKGAENPVKFQKRVIDCLDALRKLSGNTLIVAHDAVGRIIKATELGIEPHRLYEVEKYPNATLIKID